MSENDPRSLLLKCVEEGRIDVLRSLLSEISDKNDFHEIVDTPCSEIGTLLHVASSAPNPDAVRALLNCGVNPCVQNENGRTALHLAANNDVCNAFHQELLQAVASSKLGRVCQLLSAGVSIDALDSPVSKNTPLHWAATFGNEHIIKVLCEGGASVNSVNSKGDTPLHDAVTRGNADIVRKLLGYGADPAVKNNKGNDCYQMAANAPQVLQTLSMHNVQQRVRHVDSIDSELDRASVISLDRTPDAATKPPDRFLLRPDLQLESWTDYLWPQPKVLKLLHCGKLFQFPTDHKLRIYFHPSSEADPKDIMHIWLMYAPLLQGKNIQLEWCEYNDGTPGDVREGCVTCGVFGELFDRREAYTIAVESSYIQIWSSDLSGLRHSLSTFTQLLRAQPPPEPNSTPTLPCLSIRDSPDTKIRALFIDCSGCRVFSIDTLLQVAGRLGYCKLNHLFVHFEVRSTDRFGLPYTGRDISHIQRACNDLHITFVPSIDLNSAHVELPTACEILEKFANSFKNVKAFHLGVNLTEIALGNRKILDIAHKYANLVYLSVDNSDLIPLEPLPPYCILCVSGTYPLQQQEVQKVNHNLCLKFNTSDVGYFCQAPETMVKNAILAEKLSDRLNVLGTMVCDLSTGCEIMPQSLVYLSEVSIIGVAWNRATDMKRFCFILPQIAAEQILMDRKMASLFDQLLTLGYVEQELTKLGNGLIALKSGPQATKITTALSVFVQMILNPDNITFDTLTPVAFKKARIELKRSLQSLNEIKKELPYNFDLALTLAEIQLVTELMILASRLGQSLCMHGTRPFQGDVGYQIVNVGVVNLPLTTRTDLANTLLEIRAKFQHTWLSRNLASTLPNALKLFDNLFRTLLPPNMQDFGDHLL